MYDEKSKKSLNIDWKSLLIKMAILLVIVFLVIWIISLFNNKNKKPVESNLTVNLQSMKSAATEYFTESKLPTSINGKKKVTLGEMFDSKLLVEFKDQNDNACDTNESYVEATKINSTDYTIKTKLVCGSESDYIISTMKVENTSITDNNDNTDDTDKPVDETPIVDNNTDNSSNNSNNSSNNSSNNNSSNSTNNSSNTNKKPSNNNSSNSNTNNNSNTVAQTCTYGTKDYSASYPLAYVIPGNCAVKKSDYYKASYANQISSISATEYKKLNDEMTALKNKTGATLYLDTPNYYGVYNKTNTGLVGYQIMFTMKQKVNYVEKIVYQYYLDSNGNRKVVIDKRSSISNENSNNNNNNNTTIKVTSVTLNKSTLYLDVDETYTLKATINPSNATNKTVTWTSSNTRIAKVSSTGRVTALREGTVTITATVDGKSASAKLYVSEEETYRYCSTSKERVYSTSYIDLNTLGSKRTYNYSYQVALNTNNIYFDSLDYGNITTGDGYASAYKYWKTGGNKLSLVNGSTGSGIDVGSYGKLIEHSLKEYNFTPTVSYNRRSGSTLYFDINVRLKNLNNIQYTTPFYTNAAKTYGVYFVPLYFDVITIDYSDCEYITTSKVNTYLDKGYVKVN